MNLIETIERIERGEEIILCSPETVKVTFDTKDTLMARFAIGLYRGGFLQNGLCPKKLTLWFSSLPEEVANFHLWNAWQAHSVR